MAFTLLTRALFRRRRDRVQKTENVSSSVVDLIDRYQNGDGLERLHLWLQHRDLREEFDSMGQMFELSDGNGSDSGRG